MLVYWRVYIYISTSFFGGVFLRWTYPPGSANDHMTSPPELSEDDFPNFREVGYVILPWKVAIVGFYITPLKFNMEPEKNSLEKEIPFGNHHFQLPC